MKKKTKKTKRTFAVVEITSIEMRPIHLADFREKCQRALLEMGSSGFAQVTIDGAVSFVIHGTQAKNLIKIVKPLPPSDWRPSPRS